MTKEVPLTRGYVALVDDEDYDRVVAAGKWQADVPANRNTVYVTRHGRKSLGEPRKVRLHRFITGWSFVDHVNGNGLDNRRSNLRQSDASLNQYNKPVRRDSKSGYKGVEWHKKAQKWRASIYFDGRHISLGLHADIVEAALAHDRAARELVGEYACVNFPRPGERPARPNATDAAERAA